MSEPEGPEDAEERLHVPGGDGLDAPSTNGFDAPPGDSAGTPRVHGNGHPAPVTAVPGLPVGLRGRWIVPLAVVSAVTGLFLFVGAAVGTTIGRLTGLADLQLLAPAFLGGMIGGGLGVWVGSALAIRWTGGEPEGRLIPTAVLGMLGLVAGFGLSVVASRSNVSFIAALALISPGVGAAIGDRIALARQRSRRAPQR